MRDPHVVSLRYRLETDEHVSFTDPPPVEAKLESFRIKLNNAQVLVELKDHFSAIDDARKAVEDFLRAWEIDAALRQGSREIGFAYVDAEVVDRSPQPSGSARLFAELGSGTLTASGLVSMHVTRRQYPAPPQHFRMSPDVETLWNRYEGYVKGHEPLLSMANACLRWVARSAGGRQAAASRYNIHRAVLGRLGQLADQKGDELTARKFKPNRPIEPLNPREVRWVEEVVKAIIRRVGESEPGASLPELTMNDFPKLQ